MAWPFVSGLLGKAALGRAGAGAAAKGAAKGVGAADGKGAKEKLGKKQAAKNALKKFRGALPDYEYTPTPVTDLGGSGGGDSYAPAPVPQGPQGWSRPQMGASRALRRY